MASYVPSDATDFATRMVKGMTFSDVRVRVADAISKTIWMAAPWRWTVGSVDPNVAIVNGTTDYTFTIPTDFLYLVRSYIWDGTTEKPLKIESTIPTASLVEGVPSRITYVDSLQKVRVDPVPRLSGTTRTLVNLYKKKATAITESNIDSPGVLAMPDEWSWVFEEGVLWKAWEFADDDRAGTSQRSSDGKFTHTGQCARFWAAVDEMRAAEKLLLQWPGIDEIKG